VQVASAAVLRHKEIATFLRPDRDAGAGTAVQEKIPGWLEQAPTDARSASIRRRRWLKLVVALVVIAVAALGFYFVVIYVPSFPIPAGTVIHLEDNQSAEWSGHPLLCDNRRELSCGPPGWMVAGDLEPRRAQLGSVCCSVARRTGGWKFQLGHVLWAAELGVVPPRRNMRKPAVGHDYDHNDGPACLCVRRTKNGTRDAFERALEADGAGLNHQKSEIRGCAANRGQDAKRK